MNLSRAEKFWNKLANRYDQRAKHFKLPPIEQIKKYLKNSDTVLDFGCATGAVTNEIAIYVKKIVGIDISSEMIGIANRKAIELKIDNIEYQQSTIFNDAINIESFDAVLALNILHFFKDTRKVLQRINELLKPNGIIIIETACLGQWSFSNFLQRLIFTPLIWSKIIPYMKFFKLSELNHALNESGFISILQENSYATGLIVVRKT